ncbi:MAG: AAA family ATPase [Acidimicrobiia bacterium]|nr:AAA family ATPase [Acidimicrobiia bacterium]
MNVRLLGPVEVLDDDGARVELRHRKVLLLCCLLAVRSPGSVSVDELIEALWPDALPARPSAAVQTYVSRLRRALGDPTRVQRHGSAYALVLRPDESDLGSFEHLVAAGRAASTSGDPHTASVRLSEALRLFRGPVLAEVTYEECVQSDLRRIERERLDVLADRIDADLRLGRHDTCRPELEALAVAHPTASRFPALLGRCRPRRSEGTVATLVRSPIERTQSTEEAPGGEHEADAALPSFPAALAAERGRPLVGRHHALSELSLHRSGVAVVTGEPGIGKTRLVAEAGWERALSGDHVWFGRCHERPLWLFEPFVEMLNDAVTRLGPAGADLLVEMPDLGRLVPDLASAAGAPAPMAVDDATARRRAVAAVAELARHVATSGGLTLILDDLHWADEGTTHLVSMLAHRHDDLSIIATERRPWGAPSASPFGDRDVACTVHLEGLSVAEVGELARSIGPGGTTCDDTALHEHTGGNPLFVGAVVSERLEREAAGPVGAVAGWDTTATVRTVIARRVVMLGRHGTAAVAVAAVVGGDVPVAVVTSIEGDGAEAGVDEACVAGLLREGASPGTCAFVHGLARDIVYDGLGPAQRARLHRQVGEILEADLAEGSDSTAVVVASHLGASGERAARTRAVRHAASAARRALADNRFEESAWRFDLALDLVDDDTDPVELGRLLVGRATALRLAGNGAAYGAIGRAVEATAAAGDARLAADAVLLLGDQRPDADLVVHHNAALDALASDTGPDIAALQARLLVARGWHAAEETPAAARASVDEGRRLAEVHDVVPALALAQIFDWERAPLERPAGRRLADAEALVATAEAHGDHQSQLTAHNLRANALLELGDLPGAVGAMTDADRLAGMSQLPAQLALGAQRRAMLAILRGELEAAERHAADALTLMGADPSYTPIHVGQLSAIRTLQGRTEGLAELIEADEINRDRPVAVAARAALRARSGDTPGARHLLDATAERGLDAVPCDFMWTATMALAADAAVLTAHLEVATIVRPLLTMRAGHLVVFGYGAVCWGAVERFTAGLAALAGDLDSARRQYEESLATHERIGARPFAALDQLRLADVLERLGVEQARAAALRAEGRQAAALGIDVPPLP